MQENTEQLFNRVIKGSQDFNFWHDHIDEPINTWLRYFNNSYENGVTYFLEDIMHDGYPDGDDWTLLDNLFKNLLLDEDGQYIDNDEQQKNHLNAWISKNQAYPDEYVTLNKDLQTVKRYSFKTNYVTLISAIYYCRYGQC